MITDYKVTNSELAILGLIAERPMHGYEVEQVVGQRGMRQWTDIGFSSIYQILNKLARSGLLVSEKETHSFRPTRNMFRVTPTGFDLLREEIRLRLAHPRPHSGDLDLALAQMVLLSRDEIRAALTDQHQYLTERLAQVQIKWDHDRQDQHFPTHVNELFAHAQRIIQAEQEWLADLLLRIDTQPSLFEPNFPIPGGSHDRENRSDP